MVARSPMEVRPKVARVLRRGCMTRSTTSRRPIAFRPPAAHLGKFPPSQLPEDAGLLTTCRLIFLDYIRHLGYLLEGTEHVGITDRPRATFSRSAGCWPASEANHPCTPSFLQSRFQKTLQNRCQTAMHAMDAYSRNRRGFCTGWLSIHFGPEHLLIRRFRVRIPGGTHDTSRLLAAAVPFRRGVLVSA